MKFKVRKNDFVQVMRGKDRGKKGRVIRLFPAQARVLVEGINFVKKHVRPRKIDQQGGIVQMEKPIAVGNVMYFCLKCSKPSRIGIRFLEDGSRARYCRRCRETIET